MIDSDYDISGKIGPMYDTTSGAEWPMYSFNGPSMTVWGTIAAALHERGWSDARVKEWLQSKAARWAMDMDLGEALIRTAREYAASIEE